MGLSLFKLNLKAVNAADTIKKSQIITMQDSLGAIQKGRHREGEGGEVTKFGDKR